MYLPYKCLSSGSILTETYFGSDEKSRLASCGEDFCFKDALATCKKFPSCRADTLNQRHIIQKDCSPLNLEDLKVLILERWKSATATGCCTACVTYHMNVLKVTCVGILATVL